MHLTSSRNLELIGGITVFNAQRNVLKEFLVKSVAELTRGNEFTFLACKGAVIYSKGHFKRRLAYLYKFERLGSVKAGYRIAYSDIFSAREADYISHFCVFNGNAYKTVYLEQSDYLCSLGRSACVIVAYIRFLICADRAALDSSYTYSSNVLVVVDRGNEELKLTVFITLGSGNIFHYLIKEGKKICSRYVGILGSSSRSARAVEHRAVELLVGCVKVDEKLKYLILDLAKTGIGFVYLIYNYNNSVVKLKSSLEHEACLGHRTLCRVNEQNNSVYHLKYALYLAAEVCVSWGVDNIYLGVLIVNSGVLGENGNSSLFFKVARVHYSCNSFLIFTVDAALLKHFVDERSLAVVDVGNYCYVSQIVTDHRIISFLLYVHN